MKIKILYIINSFAVGGAEKMLLNLVSSLDKNVYEISIATVMGGGPLENEFAKTGAKLFIHKKSSKLGFGTIRFFTKVIKEVKPDIVHTHLWSGDFWGRVAALYNRVPFIISTEHNRNIEEGGFKKSIKHFLSYFTSVIVASSKAIKDYQIKNEKISKDKIRVIPYGISLSKFPFRGVQVARYGDEGLKFTTIGRLTYQKGQQFLIEAMARFHEEYPEIVCEIAGDGDLKEDLIDVATRLHVDKRIKFLGIVDEVTSLLNSTNIFVLPSRYEGLGIVLLEAMAVGVPIIASNIPAVNEVITHGKTGLLFESENSDDLVDQINYLLKNPELQEQMIMNARASVKNEYSLERMTKDYDKLYKEILGHEKSFAIKYK